MIKLSGFTIVSIEKGNSEIEKGIREVAQLFRDKHNLSNPTGELLVDCHDSIHYYLDLGVSMDEEYFIHEVTRSLNAGQYPSGIPVKVCDFIRETAMEARKIALEALND